jgi:putative phosphonate metabolism protein
VRRFAVYWAPPAPSALARFAASWLGRDPVTGAAVAQPELAGLPPERLREITLAPRRYGFHGTLKAPFALAPGRSADQLRSAMAALAAARRPVTLPGLELASLDGFLALVPAQPVAALDALAAACVIELDGYRAPPTADELARRRPERLSPRQRAHLERYGYPFVLEDFRFHLTLTGRLAEPEHGRVRSLLAPLVAPFCAAPLVIGELALFEQPAAAAPFLLTARFPLGG